MIHFGPWTRHGTVLLAFGVAPAAAVAQAPPRDEARAALDRLVAEAVEDGFAGQVLAVREGETLLHAGYGLADPEREVPVDTATVFAIGSVTKQFTRAAILKLEEEGLLATSDPISRFLGGLPEDKRSITIDQLLTMRAGFHEYHDDSGDHQAMTRAEALERIAAQELRFEPGADEGYSNSGYALLAAIVEEASGMSFREYVRRRLIEPAGMNSTGFHGETLWEDPLVARGHGGRRHGDNAPHHWPAVTWALMGGGGMVAPASDLRGWIAAARRGDVLGEEATAKFYPRPEANLIYAGGDDFGFTTIVVEMGGADDLVIVNRHSGYRPMSLALDMAEAMRGEPLPEVRRRVARADEAEEEGPAVVRERVGPGQAEGGPGQGRGGVPDSPRARAAMAFMEALRDGSEAALRALVEERFTPTMRDAFPMEEHLRELGRLSELARTATDVGLSPRSQFEVDIMLRGPAGAMSITLGLEPQPPHRIEGVRVTDG